MSVLDTWDTVTVWTADGNIHSGADYGTNLVKQFEKAGKKVTKKYWADVTGDEDLSDSDLHMLSGGNTPVSDRSTWMPNAYKLLRRMIGDAENGSHHLLAVCLGSQMIADILAPGSVVSGERIYAGLVGTEWHHEDSADDKANYMTLPSFHYEQIDDTLLRQAEGVQIVASNDVVPVIAYTKGSHIGATQLHPELPYTDVVRSVEYNADIIQAYGGDVENTIAHMQALSSLTPTAFVDTIDRLFSQKS